VFTAGCVSPEPSVRADSPVYRGRGVREHGRLDHQQIAGKFAPVDANDLRYQLSFRRTRHAIEFQQDYATNLQPLANDQLAKIAILRDEDAVIAICLI
jgi:hypothetical protein